MSLINKMLQDLDARGTPAAESMQVHIQPVARHERRLPVSLIALGAAGALALALAGGLGWRYLHKPAARPAPPVQPAMAVAPPPQAQPVPQPVSAPTVIAPAPVSQPVEGKKAKAGEGRKTRHDDAAPKKKGKREAALAKDRVVAAPKVAARVPLAGAGRQDTPGQRAEDAYRRGLANLQEGRVGEAIAAFEQALQVEPKHDAALVLDEQANQGLARGDEAIGQLQLGLARLQIERGGSGIDTLTRTLPYAAGSGDYQALLAGALQRQQRHREAAEQYQAALRAQPGNGVWWMGLGISLQAGQRNAEALDAFQKAKAAGTLGPELQAFVERRLAQLSR
jgi:MSHA biogenesis protein MshN